ncbi:hypothetical protein L208DRAFT_1275658 [Tricholoma matsutake]|nr:hypothetical protein L208DRAFT_1275658 [Tricholoma matsutake 945]
MHKFISQIKLLYPVLGDLQQPFIALSGDSQTQAEKNLSKFVSHVQANADKQLPFRDHTCSQMQILEEGGPFSPNIVSMPAGFFSALIFRGVTYHTNFLFNQEWVFQHILDWQTLYNKLSKMHSPKYFCDKSAYGQCMIAQDASHVPEFWAAVQDPILGGWAFPGFGPLKSFLLAADYTIAKKATMPSFTSIGKIIYEIGHGGLKGLHRLGFTCTDVTMTVQAFTAVHNHLLHIIPENCQQQIGFGIFFVEHALCKFRQLDIALFKAVYRETPIINFAM